MCATISTGLCALVDNMHGSVSSIRLRAEQLGAASSSLAGLSQDLGSLADDSSERALELQRTGDSVADAPEIVVGCRARYRVSNDSAMGKFPEDIVYDNLDAWSGCHLMASEEVPGILLSNRKIRLDDPRLYDLTVSVLREYGIDKLPGMIGRPIFE